MNTAMRMVCRGRQFLWAHRLEMRPGDIDCTDLDDAAFERQVCQAVGVFEFCPPAGMGQGAAS